MTTLRHNKKGFYPLYTTLGIILVIIVLSIVIQWRQYEYREFESHVDQIAYQKVKHAALNTKQLIAISMRQAAYDALVSIGTIPEGESLNPYVDRDKYQTKEDAWRNLTKYMKNKIASKTGADILSLADYAYADDAVYDYGDINVTLTVPGKNAVNITDKGDHLMITMEMPALSTNKFKNWRFDADETLIKVPVQTRLKDMHSRAWDFHYCYEEKVNWVLTIALMARITDRAYLNPEDQFIKLSDITFDPIETVLSSNAEEFKLILDEPGKLMNMGALPAASILCEWEHLSEPGVLPPGMDLDAQSMIDGFTEGLTNSFSAQSKMKEASDLCTGEFCDQFEELGNPAELRKKADDLSNKIEEIENMINDIHNWDVTHTKGAMEQIKEWIGEARYFSNPFSDYVIDKIGGITASTDDTCSEFVYETEELLLRVKKFLEDNFETLEVVQNYEGNASIVSGSTDKYPEFNLQENLDSEGKNAQSIQDAYNTLVEILEGTKFENIKEAIEHDYCRNQGSGEACTDGKYSCREIKDDYKDARKDCKIGENCYEKRGKKKCRCKCTCTWQYILTNCGSIEIRCPHYTAEGYTCGEEDVGRKIKVDKLTEKKKCERDPDDEGDDCNCINCRTTEKESTQSVSKCECKCSPNNDLVDDIWKALSSIEYGLMLEVEVLKKQRDNYQNMSNTLEKSDDFESEIETLSEDNAAGYDVISRQVYKTVRFKHIDKQKQFTDPSFKMMDDSIQCNVPETGIMYAPFLLASALTCNPFPARIVPVVYDITANFTTTVSIADDGNRIMLQNLGSTDGSRLGAPGDGELYTYAPFVFEIYDESGVEASSATFGRIIYPTYAPMVRCVREDDRRCQLKDSTGLTRVPLVFDYSSHETPDTYAEEIETPSGCWFPWWC